MRLVYVEWLDSFGCSATWQQLAVEKCAPLVCQSVGWLLHDSPECKVVVPHVSGQPADGSPPQGCGDMTIPTKAIVRLVDLTVPKRRTATRH